MARKSISLMLVAVAASALGWSSAASASSMAVPPGEVPPFEMNAVTGTASSARQPRQPRQRQATLFLLPPGTTAPPLVVLVVPTRPGPIDYFEEDHDFGLVGPDDPSFVGQDVYEGDRGYGMGHGYGWYNDHSDRSARLTEQSFVTEGGATFGATATEDQRDRAGGQQRLVGPDYRVYGGGHDRDPWPAQAATSPPAP